MCSWCRYWFVRGTSGMICGLTSARSANTSAITSPPKSDMPFLEENEEHCVNKSSRLAEVLHVAQRAVSERTCFTSSEPHRLPHLFSKISSVRCSSSLLLFSLLLIISRMVTARLRSLRSFSIFSYDASSFLRFCEYKHSTIVFYGNIDTLFLLHTSI